MNRICTTIIFQRLQSLKETGHSKLIDYFKIQSMKNDIKMWVVIGWKWVLDWDEIGMGWDVGFG